jgi:hypothetical protein
LADIASEPLSFDDRVLGCHASAIAASADRHPDVAVAAMTYTHRQQLPSGLRLQPARLPLRFDCRTDRRPHRECTMNTHYSERELNLIRDQGMIYQCACPAQVSELLALMQRLYTYQANCLAQTDVDARVHEQISRALTTAYPVLEKCLTDILVLEGWDMATLKMPAFLQKRLLDGHD